MWDLGPELGAVRMSSKKALRKQRRERQVEERRRTLNPAVLFMLAVGAALILAVVGAMVFGGPSGPGDPPNPGAVWSEDHGHWH